MNKIDIEKFFSLVEASKLSIDDAFLQHKPNTNQKRFKERLIAAIKAGLNDFYAPRIDPSINSDNKIYFCTGSKPGVEKSAYWWFKNAPKFMPGCRMGLDAERDAFLATLIKRELATWEQICDHSEEIGHYWDSYDTKRKLEPTGSRPLGEFYDLANTFKITLRDEEEAIFSLGGGSYCYHSFHYPLADVNDCDCSGRYKKHSVGWLILECNTKQ